MVINKCSTKQHLKDELPHKPIKKTLKGYAKYMKKHEFRNQNGDIRCSEGIDISCFRQLAHRITC